MSSFEKHSLPLIVTMPHFEVIRPIFGIIGSSIEVIGSLLGVKNHL
jgi:hypothetical protein